MLSNFGQNFKNDIFSYNSAIGYSKQITSIWNDSKSHKEYLDSSSSYINDFLRSHNVKPLVENNYYEEWSSNLPLFKNQSTLEVVSVYGRIVKKYNYGTDFFEDFKGSIKSGSVMDKAYYMDNINEPRGIPCEVLLYDGYKGKSIDEIYNIDSTLHSLGAAGVISPSYSGDLKYDSNLYELNNRISDNGLAKFIVSQSTFNELKNFAKKKYTIKIKSGADVKPVNCKNIYGVIPGKNSSYKPLVIAVFYDGIAKTNDSNHSKFDSHSLPTSMILETINSLKLQRMKSPDRTIIFAFLSNKLYGKEGLKKFLDKNLDGDIILLDGIGTDYIYSLSYTKQSKTLNDTIKYFLERSDLKITSTNIDTALDKPFATITSNSLIDNPYSNYQYINNSGKFILSILGDECYNLDILSGNIRQVRAFKRFVKSHSILLTLSALILLIFIVFKRPSIKKN